MKQTIKNFADCIFGGKFAAKFSVAKLIFHSETGILDTNEPLLLTNFGRNFQLPVSHDDKII